MKRWTLLALPLAIALLTAGVAQKGWSETIEDSNLVDNNSAALQDNLNSNDVAVDNSAIIEDNLNGPIGNDTQLAKQAANDQSIAVDDTANGNNVAANQSAVIEDNLNGPIGNDIQLGKQAANDGSLVIDDIENVANTDASITIGDIDVKVAASVLNGEVSGNTIALEEFFNAVPVNDSVSSVPPNGPPGGESKIEITTGDNSFAYGCGFTASGIFANSQNTGLMSQTQQSISVQANLINP
ncbi:MAG: hypothetical protein R2940_08280 [Syntrophotaleaceae bacterium]